MRGPMRESQPPLLARRLLLCLVPRERQTEILGDLEEEFHERARSALDLLKRAGSAVTDQGHLSVRQSLRSLRRSPGFSLLVIGTVEQNAGWGPYRVDAAVAATADAVGR